MKLRKKEGTNILCLFQRRIHMKNVIYGPYWGKNLVYISQQKQKLIKMRTSPLDEQYARSLSAGLETVWNDERNKFYEDKAQRKKGL